MEIANHCYPFKSANTFTISARSVTTFCIDIKHTENSEGYVPRLHIQDGVYVEDAVVKKPQRKSVFKICQYK